MHEVPRSLVPELDRSVEEDGTVVTELPPLLALNISGLTGGVDVDQLILLVILTK